MLRSYFCIIKCVGDGLPSLNCSLHDFPPPKLFFLSWQVRQARPKWSEEKLFTNKRETKHTPEPSIIFLWWIYLIKFITGNNNRPFDMKYFSCKLISQAFSRDVRESERERRRKFLTIIYVKVFDNKSYCKTPFNNRKY